jgi:hypothetical protein
MKKEQLRDILDAGNEISWRYEGDNYSLLKEDNGSFTLTRNGIIYSYKTLEDVFSAGVDVEKMCANNPTVFTF